MNLIRELQQLSDEQARVFLSLKPQPKLHPRALLLIALIDEFHTAHGFAPTVRDLVALGKYSTTSTVHWHLRRLVRLGYIGHIPGMARTIHLTETGRDRLRQLFPSR